MRKMFFPALFFFLLVFLYLVPSGWTAEPGEKGSESTGVDGTLEFGIGPKTPPGSSSLESTTNIENASTGGETADTKGAVDESSSGRISAGNEKEAHEKAENGILEEYKEEYKEEKDEYADLPQETPDPYENFNRAMFRFNDFLYENVMEPVATVYSEVTDDDFRGIVKSFFYNIRMPARLVSSVVQGDGRKAGRVLSRFMINTALTGGLVDVAKTEFGLVPVEEDFDQAMGVRGIKTGPYFVWPLIGPSTARSTVGGVVDGFLDPTWLISPTFGINLGIGSGKKINETAINLGVKDEIDDMSVDPYLGMRDLYLQYRKGKLAE